MNAIVKRQESMPSLAMDAGELIAVLRSSLYPGASDESIKMVIGYCQATDLDPMLKPVHIVPMKVSSGEKDQYGNDIKVYRDVIMPGIGLYRINASRTGHYAGVSEPAFGPTRRLDFQKEIWGDGKNGKRCKTFVDSGMDYPEWCSVTVEKLVDGQIRRFTAKEYWLENYAEKGDSGAPNAMWAKRPFGQIAKCAEAQALRKAFPEVGASPTAEEMEGKSLDTPRDITPTSVERPERNAQPEQRAETLLPPYPADLLVENVKKWQPLIDASRTSPEHLIATISSKYTLTPEQIDTINGLKALDGETV